MSTVYIWKARTRQGTVKRGELEAQNDAAVISQLRAQMLQSITVKKKPKDIREYLPFLKPGIRTRELVIWTRQFATMIDAGLPLVQCLQILGDQQENPTFREIIQQVREMKGVAGVHVMAYRQEEYVSEIIQASGVLANRRRALAAGAAS